jgi:hypothetical protein
MRFLLAAGLPTSYDNQQQTSAPAGAATTMSAERCSGIGIRSGWGSEVNQPKLERTWNRQKRDPGQRSIHHCTAITAVTI